MKYIWVYIYIHIHIRTYLNKNIIYKLTIMIIISKSMILIILTYINNITKYLYIVFSLLEYLLKIIEVFSSKPKLDGFVFISLSCACVHGVIGLCTLCHQAKQSIIMAYRHTWTTFSD